MKIKIADRTLCRVGNNFTFKEKIEIARQLDKLNIDIIELPIIENVKADTLLVRTISSFIKTNRISLSVALNKASIEQAANALSVTQKPRIRIEAPVSTVGMEYTCHKKAPKMIETVGELVSFAKTKISDVEFCALDATRAEFDVLTEMIEAAINSGADTISIYDAAAEMMPDDFGEFISKINSFINARANFAVVCDNKNGLAVANAVMAVKNGANVVKTDIEYNSTPLDIFASIIKNCGGVNNFESAINATELNRIIGQIKRIVTNSDSQSNSITVYDNVGGEILLNSSDNMDTVSNAVVKLGYDLSDEDLSRVFEEFQRVAVKKNVSNRELDAIIASVALQVPTTYKLKSYLINNGNIISSSAQITLVKDDKEYPGVAIGDGPIDAAFLAIEQIIGHHYELDDFQIQSVTQGKEAVGSAVVKLRSGGKLYSGNGISTDIIGAAIRAYLGAVNKIVYEETNI